MSLDTRNAELDEKLEHNPIDQQIAALVKADKARKWQVLALFIMACLLASGWWGNHNLAIRAETNREAIIRNCETSNESRAKNKQLWEYILSLPPSNNGQASTPEQQKRVEDFKVFLNDTFAPRDCQAEINKH